MGAFLVKGTKVRGLRSADWMVERELGMLKGAYCGGTEVGNGGRALGSGVRSAVRGFCRSGSTDLRYVVKTSGSSFGSLNGRSRLLCVSVKVSCSAGYRG